MTKTIVSLSICSMLFLFSCGGAGEQGKEADNTSEESNEAIEHKAAEEAAASNITGYESIDALTKEVIESLSKADYEDYLSHVMTLEMEETVSNEIQNATMKDHFLGEFGFSLEREEEEFKYMVDYLNERNITLDSINYDEIEIVDYHHDDYAPLNLKEVIITIPHDYEVPLIYVAIEIEGRWFLTSELEL